MEKPPLEEKEETESTIERDMGKRENSFMDYILSSVNAKYNRKPYI